MQSNIRTAGLVSSSQTGIHPRLEEYLQRHLTRSWSQPLHQPSEKVYRLLMNDCGFTRTQPFILDSGCGTGSSTRELARLFPDHRVIGVDQSQARLANGGLVGDFHQGENWILMRAELSTFWRLMMMDQHVPDSHFLLYPNPWPKPTHLKRRWHGHPVFPWLLALGGDIEMRCNWEIYAKEFAYAVSVATGEPINVKPHQPGCAVSPFEKKYLLRGHELFSVTVPRTLTRAFGSSR